ncbi:hypothetical protein V8E36_000089 [Tilletia maclaganii]
MPSGPVSPSSSADDPCSPMNSSIPSSSDPHPCAGIAAPRTGADWLGRHTDDKIPEQLTFDIVTLNCGAAGLTSIHYELGRAASGLLRRANIVCLQECHLASPVQWDDSKALQETLRISQPPPFRAVLGRDAGIVVRDPTLTLVESATGDRWAYALLSDTPDLGSPAHMVAVWSIHGPFSRASWGSIGDAMRAHAPPEGVPTIIGADWNSVPDPRLDSLSGQSTNIPWAVPAQAIAHLEVVDLFRVSRPSSMTWTYARTTTRSDGCIQAESSSSSFSWMMPYCPSAFTPSSDSILSGHYL